MLMKAHCTIQSIAHILGFLFCTICLFLIAQDSWYSLHIHASGSVAEATVVQPLRKSRVRVQFRDSRGGKECSAIVSRHSRFLRGNTPEDKVTIKYSPEYPHSAVVCELPDIIISCLTKGIAFLVSIAGALALFPYSWFRKRPGAKTEASEQRCP